MAPQALPMWKEPGGAWPEMDNEAWLWTALGEDEDPVCGHLDRNRVVDELEKSHPFAYMRLPDPVEHPRSNQ